MFDELAARSRQEYVQPTVRAMVAAAVGESDEALRLTYQGADEHDAFLAYAALCYPSFARVRAIPGFDKILERMGLAPA